MNKNTKKLEETIYKQLMNLVFFYILYTLFIIQITQMLQISEIKAVAKLFLAFYELNKNNVEYEVYLKYVKTNKKQNHFIIIFIHFLQIDICFGGPFGANTGSKINVTSPDAFVVGLQINKCPYWQFYDAAIGMIVAFSDGTQQGKLVIYIRIGKQPNDDIIMVVWNDNMINIEIKHCS